MLASIQCRCLWLLSLLNHHLPGCSQLNPTPYGFDKLDFQGSLLIIAAWRAGGVQDWVCADIRSVWDSFTVYNMFNMTLKLCACVFSSPPVICSCTCSVCSRDEVHVCLQASRDGVHAKLSTASLWSTHTLPCVLPLSTSFPFLWKRAN